MSNPGERHHMRQRRLSFALLPALAVFGLGACSDSDSAAVSVDGPCDLLLAEDAGELLGDDVERIGFLEFVERENGAIPEGEMAAAENAAERNCVYESAPAGDEVVAVQLDRRMFPDLEEFRSAWGDDVEILDGPGLAASYEGPGEDHLHVGAVSVVLNDAGDSFALVVYRSDVERASLLGLAEELAERYGD